MRYFHTWWLYSRNNEKIEDTTTFLITQNTCNKQTTKENDSGKNEKGIDPEVNKIVLCGKSISQNLQPIRNNKNNIKYHWMIFTMSLLFSYKQLYNRRSKVLFVIVSLIQFTIAFHTLNVVCRSKPSLNTNLRNSPTKEFFTIEVLHITCKINEFSADMHFKLFTISKMRTSTIGYTWKWY